jgi:acyl carrier protein
MTIGNFSTAEAALQKIVGRVTHNPDVVLNRNLTFKDLGADSMDVVQIMVSLEEALDIDLVDKELKAITNMGEFMDYLDEKVDGEK